MRSRPVASSGVKGSPEASVPRPISFVEIDFVTAPSWFLLVLAQRKARRVKEGGEQGVFPCTAGLSGCSFAPITVTIGEQRQTITRPGPAPHPAYRPTRPKLPAAAALSLSAGP